MSDTTKKRIPEPHLDPGLILFLALVAVLALIRIASAQTPTPAPGPGGITGIPVVDLIIQTGVPAGLTIYLVVWGLPNIIKEFRAEMAVERASHEAEVKQIKADYAQLFALRETTKP